MPTVSPKEKIKKKKKKRYENIQDETPELIKHHVIKT
jgi:hypothetical protein